MADSLVGLDSGGCVAPIANGTVGQVMTIGAGGTPTWVAATDASVLSTSGIQGTGLAGDEIKENFDALPIDNATLDPVTDSFVMSTATYPDGARVTRQTAANLLLCNAPGVSGVQPGGFITTRDDGTGCEVENFTPQKQISNAGATVPIAVPVVAGVQNLLSAGVDFSAETNDIIPYIGDDGVRRWDLRAAGLEVVGVDAGTQLVAGTYVTIPYTTVTAIRNISWVKPVATVIISGVYMITAQFRITGKDYLVSQGVDIIAGINGAVGTHEIGSISIGTSNFASHGQVPRIHGSRLLWLNAGDTIRIIGTCTAFTEDVIADTGGVPQPAYFSIVRLGPQ